jgi:hypothetical protein
MQSKWSIVGLVINMNLNIVKGISNIEYSGPIRIQDKVHVGPTHEWCLGKHATSFIYNLNINTLPIQFSTRIIWLKLEGGYQFLM